MGRWLYGHAKRLDGLAGLRRSYFSAIGRRIKNARLERGVSVSELAEAIGSAPATIHAIEHDYPKRHKPDGIGPSIWLIIRIARALDVEPSELIP